MTVSLLKRCQPHQLVATVQELKDTKDLGKRGELYVLGQLALVFLVIFPVVDLHLPLQLLGFASIGLGGREITLRDPTRLASRLRRCQRHAAMLCL